MKILIIQENGRHEANRLYRECFCLQRSFARKDISSTVWGLGHSNYEIEPDWNSYDIIINLENYDTENWVPNLSSVKSYKILWSIDAHVRGINTYLETASYGSYDLILQATPEFLTNNSIWFPNCYDDKLIRNLHQVKKHNIGFCGNINNRGGLIKKIMSKFTIKIDEFVIGEKMVDAINSYGIHFNANISIDINYRNFETIGCGTCLLTSYNKHYGELGFVDGYNCIMYSNENELLDKITFGVSNLDYIENIASNGYELAKNHTYDSRVSQLLQHLGIK
jgi:hypothetical protein